MRLGRNFTNLLEYEYLTDEEKAKFDAGELKVPDMDALAQARFKKDIIRQIEVANEINLRHVELDGGIPNPYLGMDDEELFKAREVAEKLDVTLSLHLPYTYVAEATCSFQEEDRQLACEYLKRYLDMAAKVGCTYCVMHPGTVPFYQAEGRYLKIMENMLIRSLKDLGAYSQDKGMLLHLENNTAFDTGFVTTDEIYPVMDAVREAGIDVRFCFDLAHTFTQVQTSAEIPDPPEAPYEDLPEELLYSLHIGDYVPEQKLFHPPIHHEKGKMKEENFKNMARIFEEKGVEVVIIETAVRDRQDLINGYQIMAEETAFLADIFNK